MFKSMHRHVNATSVVAVIALLLAMTGGAYAAGVIKITSIKQISPKVVKQLQGKTGKAGANGVPGPAGASGPQGAAGPQGPGGAGGAKGETGSQGPQGVPGNPGKEGKKGETGSPWPAGGTLPEGATETGVWRFGPVAGSNTTVAVASFPIPLAKALDEEHVHVINSKGEEILFGEPPTTVPPTKCGEPVGTAAAPKAASGNLCIYITSLTQAETYSQGVQDPTTSNIGAATSGAFLQFIGEGQKSQTSMGGQGTWAVTG